jgi:hypothetical protein
MTFSILKGIHRRALSLGNSGEVVARHGLVSGGEDKPVVYHPGPDTVTLFEDFTGLQAGDTGASTLRYGPSQLIIGFSDTGQVVPRQGPVAPGSAFANGVFRMTSSATSAQDPVAGAQSLNTPAIWKANQGQQSNRPLHFGTRLKTNTLAGNTLFVGFTDSGGTEMAAYDTGAGILTPAADYAGFIWSGEGGATQQAYRAVTGKAGVDQSATTGITPTAGVYDVLEVEVSPDGNVASFFINGKSVAQITSAALTPTVALGAGIWRANTDAAADAIDIDWINVAAPRDTGT